MNVEFKNIDEDNVREALISLEHNIYQVYNSTKQHMDKVENDIYNIINNELPDIRDELNDLKKEQQRIVEMTNSSTQIWLNILSNSLYGIFGAILTFFITKWLS